MADTKRLTEVIDEKLTAGSEAATKLLEAMQDARSLAAYDPDLMVAICEEGVRRRLSFEGSIAIARGYVESKVAPQPAADAPPAETAPIDFPPEGGDTK